MDQSSPGRGDPEPSIAVPHQFVRIDLGVLIGAGNGDPNCQESDKGSKRSLFNGLAQVIVQSTRQPGEIQIEAVRGSEDDPELTPAKVVITTRRVELRPAVPETNRG